MQFATVFLAFFALLAGRVYASGAMNITLNMGGLGNVTASQFLTINDTDLTTKCQSNCTDGFAAISGCGDTNATCLCSTATVQAVVKCEQCYFNWLIAENRPMPDPRAGNAVALTQYVAACAADNATVNTTAALVLPSNWDGPFGQFLNTGGTVFGVIVSLVLGVGAITIVTTM